MRRKRDEPVKRTRRTSTALTTVKSKETQLFEELRGIQDDICLMYEEGAQPADLARKYPLFTEEEIWSLLQERYDLTKVRWNLVEGVFFNIYRRNLSKLQTIISEAPDLDSKMKAIDLLNGTVERAVKYKELLDKNHSIQERPLEEGEVRVHLDIEYKLKQKLEQIAPPERPKFIESLRGKTQEEIRNIIEGEYTITDNENNN